VQDVEEYQCKVVVIGPPATGKTSLVRRYTHGTFERGYKQTIGVDFEVKTIPWNNNITIHVQLWDIAGQERFSAVVPVSYIHVYY
jgi:small GTP-binding protein